MSMETPAHNDPKMWKRLLAAIHPDRENGDHELFVWAKQIQEGLDELANDPQFRRPAPPPPPRRTQTNVMYVTFSSANPFGGPTSGANGGGPGMRRG